MCNCLCCPVNQNDTHYFAVTFFNLLNCFILPLICPCWWYCHPFSICHFIVILHISCCRLCILETLPLILCSSPDSLGEILVIFQSAVVFMGFLSSLFMLCHHVPWLSHFSRGNTSESDTFYVLWTSQHICGLESGIILGPVSKTHVLHSSCITLFNICKQYANGKMLWKCIETDEASTHCCRSIDRLCLPPWNKKPHCSADVLPRLCGVHWNIEMGNFGFF